MNVTYDSKEEEYFSWWIEELETAGFIKSWGRAKPIPLSGSLVYQYSIALRTKEKQAQQVIMEEHSYTPDFEIDFNEKAYNMFCCFPNNKKINFDLLFTTSVEKNWLIEVKPQHDYKNMTRLNTINRKWVMSKHNTFINLRTPVAMFQKTFTPKRYLFTDKAMGNRKLSYEPITLEQFIINHHERNNQQQNKLFL